MAATIRSIAIILISMARILNIAYSAATPAVDCTSLVLSMADCLSYVTAGSTTVKPEGTCCSGLKSVLKTDAECLCEAFKNSAQFGVTLNVTKALSLPSACHVSAPSVNNCGLVNIAPAPTTTTHAAGAISPSAAVGVAPSPRPTSTANEVLSPASAPTSSVSSSHCVSPASFAVAIIASLMFYSF